MDVGLWVEGMKLGREEKEPAVVSCTVDTNVFQAKRTTESDFAGKKKATRAEMPTKAI